MGKFCTVPEAAEQFGVDRKTMYRWVTSGKIPSIVTPGGHYRILRSEISRLLESNAFAKIASAKTKCILVVDDDESVRKTMKRRLAREKFTVETASDGFTAGLKARDVQPNLIVLDLMMNGVDGFEVCRTIRADHRLKGTRILIMTGFDTPEHRERAIQEGADDFLPKGGSFKMLLTRINELLGG